MLTIRVAVAFTLLLSMVAAGSAAATASIERATYIVVLDDSVTDVEATARSLAHGAGGELGFVYEYALKGFSAELSAQAASALARNPRVAFVEADQLVQVADTSPTDPLPTGIDRINADQNTALKIDGNDERVTGAVVAVIDTGIDFDHPDLNVNTTKSVNCSGGSPFKGVCGSGGDDDNGHGTHVAGTIGALDNGPNVGGINVVGVAPGVEQWAVKVLRSDGSGYISWIVAGIDYVTKNAGTVDVANMSLGCECSSAAMDDAITKSVAAGVTYAVAAGNSAKDASTFSPANHPDVITVSALADFDGEPGALVTDTSNFCRDDEDDTLANFSNFGASVEVTAPGVCILSTVPGGYATYSGTSMASPHVAGAAALLAASGISSPGTIRSTLISTGNTLDWTDEVDKKEEPRIDVADSNVFKPSMTGGGGGGTNSPPTASFGSSCPDLTCAFTSTSSDTDGSVTLWSWTFGDESGSTAENPLHTYGSGGTYTVTLTVTDNGGATNSTSQDVTVSSGSVSVPPNGTVYVGDLDGTAIKNKGTWRAEVWIRVVKSDGSASLGLNGVTVTGLWSPSGTDGSGIEESLTCTTVNRDGEDGWCQVQSGWFGMSTGSTSWTVTKLDTTDYTAPDGVSDPDGDSDLKSITVIKP